MEKTTNLNAQLQRVIVRMLYDADFSKWILAKEENLNALKLALPMNSWQMLSEVPTGYYEADPYRSHRSLQAIIRNFPISFAFDMLIGDHVKHALDFFHSSYFHDGIQQRLGLNEQYVAFLKHRFENQKKQPLHQLKIMLTLLELEWNLYLQKQKKIKHLSKVSPQVLLASSSAKPETMLLRFNPNLMMLQIPSILYQQWILLNESLAKASQEERFQILFQNKIAMSTLQITEAELEDMVYLCIDPQLSIEELPKALFEILSACETSPQPFLSIVAHLQSKEMSVEEALELLDDWIKSHLLFLEVCLH
jgi:hypothetical protein